MAGYATQQSNDAGNGFSSLGLGLGIGLSVIGLAVGRRMLGAGTKKAGQLYREAMNSDAARKGRGLLSAAWNGSSDAAGRFRPLDIGQGYVERTSGRLKPFEGGNFPGGSGRGILNPEVGRLRRPGMPIGSRGGPTAVGDMGIAAGGAPPMPMRGPGESRSAWKRRMRASGLR